jgi:type IV secretory pathway VirB3-like protein
MKLKFFVRGLVVVLAFFVVSNISVQSASAQSIVPTVTLSATQNPITLGQSSSLVWFSTGATSCTASGGWTGVKTISWPQTVTPIVNTSYSITCSGAGGTSATASVTIAVNAVNPIKRAAVRQLYLDLLHRVPDQQGWDYFTNSSYSIDQIRIILLNSAEYTDVTYVRPPGNILTTGSLAVSAVGIGTGHGTVTGVGLNCGAVCTTSLPIDSEITLTATPDIGSVFTGWSGDACVGSSIPSCTFYPEPSAIMIASFYSNKTNDTDVHGGSIVLSQPALQLINPNTNRVDITLSWSVSGLDVDASGIYGIFRHDDRSISQFYQAIGTTTHFTYTDSVLNTAANYSYLVRSVDSNSRGLFYFAPRSNAVGVTISASPYNLSTPTNMSASVSGSQVTLTWNPSTGSVSGYHLYRNGTLIQNKVFSPFTDTIRNSGDIYSVVAFDTTGNVSPMSGYVQAIIVGGPATTQYTITSSYGPNGSISVTGVVYPSYTIASGGSMTLNITPSYGYRISTLTIDNVSQATSNSYTFSNITANHTISATFETIATPSTYAISVSKPGTGTGVVSGGGISCGTSCFSTTITSNIGTPVTLTATPNAGSTFIGWNGACTGMTTCTLSSVGTVTATFNTANTAANGAVQAIQTKRDAVQQLYLNLMQRLPDQQGLDYWTNSSYSMDQIRTMMMNTSEYFVLHNTTVTGTGNNLISQVNGGWSAWSPVSCPTACGQSASILTRSCNNPSQSGTGTQCTANGSSATQSCPATAQCLTPDLTPNIRDGVQQLYLNLMQRDPDQQGWDFWTNSSYSIDQIRTIMMNGIEYKTKQSIIAIYNEILHRAPTTLELTDWYTRSSQANFNTDIVRQALTTASVIPANSQSFIASVLQAINKLFGN